MSDNLKQGTLFEMKKEHQTGPVTCLGLTFENDDARRAYFTEELRKKLPDLKKIDGFPIGNDEDILALSDPPYYTACPNPWVSDFVKYWESQKDITEDYHREPFASDVAEGKNDPIYNAHSYHTKVPHKAIMRYILHYTKPGDIVFDGFSGTGMTGVAAQFCGDPEQLFKGNIEQTNAEVLWGKRNAILCDLSPAAAYISYNYNKISDAHKFEYEAKKLLAEVEEECGWMFQTQHTIGETVQKDARGEIIYGRINYTVWSDAFVCPACSNEFVFWNAAVNEEEGKVEDSFPCPSCSAVLTKNSIERAWHIYYDNNINETVKQAKQVPVQINYSVGNKRFEKKPDAYDMQLLNEIDKKQIPYWFPTDELPPGFNTEQPKKSHGYTHVHHFFVKQNLWVFSKIASLSKSNPELFCLIGDMIPRASKMHKIAVSRLNSNLSKTAGVLSGTLYIPSNSIAYSALEMLSYRIKDVSSYLFKTANLAGSYLISNQSVTSVQVPDNSIDYIFTDPPFGSNLMYSELNFLWESWLKVFTSNPKEAIVNKVQQKSLDDYKDLMTQCFREAHRILKPNRWITVEFSNSQASVWNAIQESIQRAGFIIANVSALDKKQGSFKAVTTTTAVKQDLVISAYKPKHEVYIEIRENNTKEMSVWLFVRNHLANLPVFIEGNNSADLIVERTPRILFDRMVAFYVQNGYSVPISSADFQNGVEQRFPMRDGMAFLETQVIEYDKKREKTKGFSQVTLFVSDENSAIEWIRQQLLKKPQTRQDLQPNYMKEIQHIAKHEKLPELDVLLDQNFLKYDENEDVPSQIHTYLSSDYKDLRNLSKKDRALKLKAKDRWYVPDPNKQSDLEKLRERALLREFETYRGELNISRKKLKQFRTEAIRAGFKKAWGEKDYQTIVTIGERLPENVLQEDDKLLMYYDNAQIRLGL